MCFDTPRHVQPHFCEHRRLQVVPQQLKCPQCAVGATEVDDNVDFVRVTEQTSEGWVTIDSDIWEEGAIGGHSGCSLGLSPVLAVREDPSF